MDLDVIADQELIDAWLDSKGVSFWCDWNVNDDQERFDAAGWFVGQLLDLDDWARIYTDLLGETEKLSWPAPTKEMHESTLLHTGALTYGGALIFADGLPPAAGGIQEYHAAQSFWMHS